MRKLVVGSLGFHSIVDLVEATLMKWNLKILVSLLLFMSGFRSKRRLSKGVWHCAPFFGWVRSPLGVSRGG
jgi:hypothetical protein